jgi:ABC-type branched-subunit amino acid transport system substrate-binding protein
MTTTTTDKRGLFAPGTLRTMAFFLAGIVLGATSALQLAPAGGIPVADGQQVADNGVYTDPTTGQQITDGGGNTPGGGNGGNAGGGTPSGTGGNAGDAGQASGGTNGASAGPGPGGAVAPGGERTGPTAGGNGGNGGAGGNNGNDGTNLPGAASQLECAPGRNGGATDQGVTDTEIRMATTTVDSGPGASFLRDVRFGMEAMRNEVNRTGGICGRQLSIRYVDDGWSPPRGSQFLRTFINQPDPSQKIFAIPVGPSSEGLGIVIEGGDIDRAELPVVGTNGLSVSQYTKGNGAAQPWVWPVAAATVSSARIMVKEAYARGARKFSVVFDRDYRFGKEAALAFNEQVKALTKREVEGFNTAGECNPGFCGIESGQQSYSSQVREFNQYKGDFVGVFLEPTTAQSWMGDANTPRAMGEGAPKYGYGAAQPLFTKSFAQTCKDKCHGMYVWTGFKPNIEGYRSDPAVQRYINALKQTNPQADEFNQFAEGAYVGMQLLVEGLRKAGPQLTRGRLKAALDSIKLNSGLTITPTLQFSPNNRFTATQMQAFVMQYKGYASWRSGPIVSDPALVRGG